METFRSKSPAEFFLTFKETAGLSNPKKIIYITVRELIENSLDACERVKRLPYINLQITRTVLDEFEVKCIDNGSGVPAKHIPEAFAKFLVSSKYTLCQHRGIFGFGGKLVALYGQTETGKPLRVMSSTDGKTIHKFILKTDIRKNEPKVLKKERKPNHNNWIGTGVAFHTRGDLRKALPLIIKYLDESSLINPYATIILKIKDKTMNSNDIILSYRKIVNQMPEPPREMSPHPASISRMDLSELIKSYPKNMTLSQFLKANLHRVGKKSASEFLRQMRLEDRKIRDIDDNTIRILHQALHTYTFPPPDIRYLSILGKTFFLTSIQQRFKTLFTTYSSRASSYSGYPFVIETVVGYGGELHPNPDNYNLHRYANRMPLITDYHDAIYHVIKNINLKRYRFDENSPLGFFIHIVSVKIPFKSHGKESIAEVDEIKDKIRLSLQECLRKLRRQVSRRERMKSQGRRWNIIKHYLAKISKFTSDELGRPYIPPETILSAYSGYSTEIKRKNKNAA